LLVDVRGPAEFAVSHLRDAVNLRTEKAIAEVIACRRPVRTVLYCSVGFRSSRLAHQVGRRTISDVFNLEGSIFQWANEGHTVYQDAKPVLQVHPYGRRWIGLLKEGLASTY
jgi:rhodanese-related sulfurtransferase